MEEEVERLQESELVDDPRKQHLSNTTELMHIWTQRDCDSMHKTSTSSNQTKYQHGEEVDTMFHL